MLKTWILSISFILSSYSYAQTEETVEFLINAISRTSEWGHVSIRVKGPDVDKIYDFGRYGYMWYFNGEGDPVLRVWNNSFDKYLKYRTQADRTMTRFVFQSDAQKNSRILEHFDRMLARGKKYTGKEGRWASKGGEVRNYTAPGSTNFYVPDLGEFHATDNNCTTISVDAFQLAFDEKIYGERDYIKARGFKQGISYYNFNFLTRGIVESQLSHKTEYNKEKGRVFWPADLNALLIDKSKSWSNLIRIEEYTKFDQQPKIIK